MDHSTPFPTAVVFSLVSKKRDEDLGKWWCCILLLILYTLYIFVTNLHLFNFRYPSLVEVYPPTNRKWWSYAEPQLLPFFHATFSSGSCQWLAPTDTKSTSWISNPYQNSCCCSRTTENGWRLEGLIFLWNQGIGIFKLSLWWPFHINLKKRITPTPIHKKKKSW